MLKKYRIVMQYTNEDGEFTDVNIIDEGCVKNPERIIDLGFRHVEQIQILRKIQDSLLRAQSVYLKEDITYCPQCNRKLIKNGTTKSTFNAVFTDHKVPVYRLLCTQCKWQSVPSINSLFGTHMHPDLTKLQCEHAGEKSYKKAETDLNKQSGGEKRTVNSTMTLHGVVEQVGNYISAHHDMRLPETVKPTAELVLQVDGGHIKAKDPDARSFEAMTSVVYNPDNIKPKAVKKVISLEEFKKTTKDDFRGEITRKHCAASALDDHQEQIKKLTLLAAKKEGLTKTTSLIALSDGAQNCWNVIDSLEVHCATITRILDWFHIAMKFQTISLPEKQRSILDRAKWGLWNGNANLAIERLNELNKEILTDKNKEKISKLINYINNNKDKIVNYSERKRNGLVFTSNIAECTVESLINQRCKGQQHMRWSREGVHSLLQIRAAMASTDWVVNWENYVTNAYPRAS